MSSELAIRKREEALDARESKIQMQAVRAAAASKIRGAEETAKKALAKSKEIATSALETSAMYPLLDGAAEFAGMVIESGIKKKLSESVHNAVPFVGLAVETVALWEIIKGGHKPATVELLRLTAAGARGTRTRETLGWADNVIDRVFG